MTKGRPLLIAALIFNLVILIPVVSSLLLGIPGLGKSLGPVTDGRLILTAIYAAIAIVSAGLLGLHMVQAVWAVPMTVALFCVQITYKLITVPLVGLDNPVVITNLVVVAVQLSALGLLWSASRKAITTEAAAAS